jgi:hypothetical protein
LPVIVSRNISTDPPEPAPSPLVSPPPVTSSIAAVNAVGDAEHAVDPCASMRRAPSP